MVMTESLNSLILSREQYASDILLVLNLNVKYQMLMLLDIT